VAALLLKITRKEQHCCLQQMLFSLTCIHCNNGKCFTITVMYACYKMFAHGQESAADKEELICYFDLMTTATIMSVNFVIPFDWG